MSVTRQVVAQISNLLYRRFPTCGRLNDLRAAECNSAIRQIGNLRYGLFGFVLVAMVSFGQLFAESTNTNVGAVQFQAIDVFVNTKDKPLAAYQLEFSATVGEVKIVGIEGGEHPAFAQPPFYDPKAMQHDRVIIAAFSTEQADKLPKGKTRVATIHAQVGGTV